MLYNSLERHEAENLERAQKQSLDEIQHALHVTVDEAAFDLDMLQQNELEDIGKLNQEIDKLSTNEFQSELDKDIPKSFHEAVTGPKAKEWKEAIDKEMFSILENKTFTTVPVQHTIHNKTNVRYDINNKPLKLRWVFDIKKNPDGSIERYKARLVVRGYTQRKGIHFEETFAPVLRYSSFRMIIALAAKHKLQIHHIDVTTAFLYGDIDTEDLYCEPVEGFEENVV